MALGIDNVHLKMTDYDPEWKKLGEEAIALVRRVMGADALDIQHVGSTAIVGMFAKPVIDIAVLVENFDVVETYAEAFREQGMSYLGEVNKNSRSFSVSDPASGLMTHMIHFVARGLPKWDEFLNLRDYCNAVSEERDAYIAIKKKILVQLDGMHEGYNAMKNDFLQGLIARAAVWRSSEK